MLQLRPGSSSLSSSPTSSSLHAHSQLLSRSADAPTLLATTAALHPYSPSSTSPSSNATPSTATISRYAATTTTTSTATAIATSAASAKKPFQNLGLHSGAASGNLGLVKFALDNGQPIDSVVNGVLPIHAACCSNANVAVVLFLIERGADVNARRYPRKYSGERVVGAQTVGTTGSTPLHFAAANGCLTIVEILLRHGAVADLADKASYGSTPYSVATARNHPEVASVLHQHSAMQRGLQVITPIADLRDSRDRDPFTSPRNSGDFSRRVSAIMALNTTLEPTPSNIRRRSVDTTATGYLSPPPSRTIHQRRVSLDQIRPLRPTDGKLRRDSDASTSETVVSGHSSCSTLVNPMTTDSNDSRSHPDMAPVEELEEKHVVESVPMGRSVSQPPLSPSRNSITATNVHRTASTPFEPRYRQSLDLRMSAFLHDQDMAEADEEADEDRKYRRRSIQGSFGDRDHSGSSFFARTSGPTSSSSVASFQETSSSSRDAGIKGAKHRASFSGSATISGRFSRLWTYGSGKDGQEDNTLIHGKDGSAESVGSLDLLSLEGSDRWAVGELSKANAETMGLYGKEGAGGRSRVGVMNRLTGMWARR
ncbi:hypothetical protein BGZ99_008835 [Dissophora globulifera]|uniref:protein S-acyltransferase n=1 Tax=Dissophora globulifera TaxID=979702 RepID=A0A9P6RB27_9FUNG|nr:hypothetical protein BGZ99_008835 [Dissophora globulifera]